MELLADQLFLGITSWRLCFPRSPFISVDARWSRLSSLENTRRQATLLRYGRYVVNTSDSAM
jgi:hypothetical protein